MRKIGFMEGLLRWVTFLIWMGIFVVAGCGGGNDTTAETAQSTAETAQGGALNVSYTLADVPADAVRIVFSLHDPVGTTCDTVDPAQSIVPPQIIEPITAAAGSVGFSGITLPSVVVSGVVQDNGGNILLSDCLENVTVPTEGTAQVSLTLQPLLDIGGTYHYSALITEPIPVEVETFLGVVAATIDSIPEDTLPQELQDQIIASLDVLGEILNNPEFSGPQTITQTGNRLLFEFSVEEFGGQDLGETIKIVGNGPGEFVSSRLIQLEPSDLIFSFTEIVLRALEEAVTVVVTTFEDELPPGYTAEDLILLINLAIRAYLQPFLDSYFGSIQADQITITGPITVDKTDPVVELSSTELKMVVTPGEGSSTQPNEIPMRYDAIADSDSGNG